MRLPIAKRSPGFPEPCFEGFLEGLSLGLTSPPEG